MQECYNQLLAEGYLTSRVGSATRVAAGARPAPPAPPPGPVPPSRLIADFRSGVPDLASFPREDWTWATREACLRVATADLDYGDPRGSAVLRQVVAAYLRRVRAAAADHERIVVCTGFAQGLNLVLRVLSQLGVRRAALEDPGYGDLAVSDSARGAPSTTIATIVSCVLPRPMRSPCQATLSRPSRYRRGRRAKTRGGVALGARAPGADAGPRAHHHLRGVRGAGRGARRARPGA